MRECDNCDKVEGVTDENFHYYYDWNGEITCVLCDACETLAMEASIAQRSPYAKVW